jgi:REP element-mobilizing transposase RayT
MPKGLVRHQQAGHLHFITISCHRHTNILGTPAVRNILQQILEDTRRKYRFYILGYVFMSNHIHLLITEPDQAKLSTAIQSSSNVSPAPGPKSSSGNPVTTTSTSSRKPKKSKNFVTCIAIL